MPLRLRRPYWMLPLAAVLFATFVSAGLWQLRRGHEKERLESALAAAPASALDLTAATPPPGVLSAPTGRATGHYEPARQMLLDNQSYGERPGYRVWTPLALDGGGWVVVDRGWVPADPDRARLPAIDVASEPRTVKGTWRPLPRPGLRLGTDACQGAFPRVVNYPVTTLLACMLGGPVANGILLLDPSEPDGFVREWTKTDAFPPSRHYGYAAQWFAFAATLLFLFLRFGVTRKP